MRYTESDFTIDHIFDFIRLVFSSIFLAPFRFCNEYSKKLLFIDKERIKQHIVLALGLNVLLGVSEIIRIVRTRTFIVLQSNIPALLISMVLIGGLYYLVQIYDQPKVTYGKKPRPIKSNRKAKVKFDAEDLIEDNEEAIEQLAKDKDNEDINGGLDISKLKMNSPEKEKVDLSLDLSSFKSEIDYDLMPKTSQETLEDIERAYKEDVWNVEELFNTQELQEEEEGFMDVTEDLSLRLDSLIENVDVDAIRSATMSL